MKLFLKIVFFALVFTGFKVNAQLPVPDLEVVVVDENCDGTGQLTFNLTGTAPGATILYSVFLLPNTTVPVYSGSNNVVSLAGGTYNVVAVQTLGNESNIVTVENVVIEDLVGALTFSVTSTDDPCGGGRQIIVTVLSGSATQYEISSGPVTVPPQESNVFSGLPEGDYIIRVYDPCGAAIPRTFTLTAPNIAPPAISGPIYEEVITTNCTSVIIRNNISYDQGTIVVYPLTVVYTLHPGDGSPDVIVSEVVTSGNSNLAELTHTFDLVPGRTDTYDIQVTNGCNMAFPPKTGMFIAPVPRLSLSKVLIPCGQYYLRVTARNFSPPYRLTFLDPPLAQFNPSNFNASHPEFGADEATVAYGGEGNPVPEGLYTVEITDACGRSSTASINIIYETPVPVVGGNNNGCYSVLGSLSASVPERVIVFAEIVDGPPNFTEATPYNVSSFIGANGSLRVPDLPTGDYVLTFVDNCGERYENIPVNIPEFSERDFEGSTRPDCTIGLGGVRVSSLNGALTSIEVTTAPSDFNGGVTPVDVSEFIASGVLYLDNLPAGSYRFKGMDVCGIERSVNVNVTGAQAPLDAAVVPVPGCNAFNLDLNDTTAVDTATYWLQMENPAVPGEWGNPVTGTAYPEGSVPNGGNSIALTNNSTNINFDFSGTFRVIKAYEAIGRGVASKSCVSQLGLTFSYSDDVIINDVYNLSCRPGDEDVFVDATGFAPLRYSIDLKDGLPFILDNGTNPVFSNLAPGSYRFVVENACTELITITRDISTLPDIVAANPADDIQICIESGDSQFQEFDLEAQTPQILGIQSPLIYTVTYHRSQADANTGSNPLVSPYTNIRNPQTIYARVLHNFINVCPRTVSFQIRTTVTPVLNVPEEQYLCTDVGRLVLSANPGYDQYQWISDHPITQLSDSAIEVYEPGLYTVVVSRIMGTLPPCSETVAIEVFESETPQDVTFDIEDWTEHNNVIRLNVNGNGAYEYSLDGENFQDSPVFTGLDTGTYTVYINDTAGCGMVSREVVLLNYPKYFTPNGDGTHETWHIRYSSLEPNLVVYIYDRFGKLITNFGPESEGWDGTFNGHPLPATDYWFVVNRQDGRVLKGHFSLLR